MRDLFTTLLEVAGFAAITTGVALLEPRAGLIVGGMFAVVAGGLAGRS
jgi:divalent metal cation (Fe/Co/Zn/Cd) transporter